MYRENIIVDHYLYFFYFACLSTMYLFGKYNFFHCSIALLLAYILMIGLYTFTNNIQ
jgi:hypothetical protein